MVQRGRSVVFECKVKHDPTLTPTITWLKDDGELPEDERSALPERNPPRPRPRLTGVRLAAPSPLLRNLSKLSVRRFTLESDSLSIADVTEGDAGVYTCITNTTLDQDSASAELTVVGKLGSPGARCHRLTDGFSSVCAADCLSSVSRLIAGAFRSCQQHEYLIVIFSASRLMFFLPMFLTI